MSILTATKLCGSGLLKVVTEAIDQEMGNKQGAVDYPFTRKNASQGVATYVVAAFDPKLDGECSQHVHFLSSRFTQRVCRAQRGISSGLPDRSR